MIWRIKKNFTKTTKRISPAFNYEIEMFNFFPLSGSISIYRPISSDLMSVGELRAKTKDPIDLAAEIANNKKLCLFEIELSIQDKYQQYKRILIPTYMN